MALGGNRGRYPPRSALWSMLKACVMAGRVNWSRISSRDRMRRQGVEDVKGKTPLALTQPPKQPRRKLSKAELREQAEAAFLAWREGQTGSNARPVASRRPGSIDELAACFVVRDHNGQQLAYVLEDEPGRRSAAKLLSKRRGESL